MLIDFSPSSGTSGPISGPNLIPRLLAERDSRPESSGIIRRRRVSGHVHSTSSVFGNAAFALRLEYTSVIPLVCTRNNLQEYHNLMADNEEAGAFLAWLATFELSRPVEKLSDLSDGSALLDVLSTVYVDTEPNSRLLVMGSCCLYLLIFCPDN